MKKTVLLLVILLMGFTSAANADFILVSDIVSFGNHCPTCNYDLLTENFEDATLLAGLSIDSEYLAAGGDGGINTQLGVFQDRVGTAADYKTTFSYTPPLFGFGGWFDLASPGVLGPGASIDVYADNEFVGNIPSSATGQFWGFFTTGSTFTEVLFKSPNLGQETYLSVDLSLCATQPVPIPTAVLLLGSGLIGYVGIRRRKFI